MTGWRNPRWNSLRGPDAEALRAIFHDLEKFLDDPSFQSINLGEAGASPTVDVETGVVIEPPTTAVDTGTFVDLDADLAQLRADLEALDGAGVATVAALPALPDAEYPDGTVVVLEVDNRLYRSTGGAWVSMVVSAGELDGLIEAAQIAAGAIGTDQLAANAVTAAKILAAAVETDKLAAGAVTASKIAAWDMLVGQHIQSIDYDGTDVATGDATSGFRMEAGGDAEFNSVRVRGEIEASEFRGAPTVGILGVNGTFDTNIAGWTAHTAEFPSSAIARDTTTVRSGAGSLRIESSSGADVCSAYTEVTVAPGDIVHASGWVRKHAVSNNAADAWWDTVYVNVDFYDGTNTPVHRYFYESIQANAVEWQLLEVYAAAPLGLGVTKARVYFSSYSNAAVAGKYALYVDDVTIGIAPLLEVPYMVTHEDGDRRRALITPQQFTFDTDYSYYPFGLMAAHYPHEPSLRVTGPYSFAGAPQIELTNDLLNDTRTVRVFADELKVAGRISFDGGNASAPGLYFEGRPKAGVAFATTGGIAAPILVNENGYYSYVNSSGNGVFPHHSTTTAAANVFMTANGALVRSTSSRKRKNDVETLDASVIDLLRPVTYRVKPEAAGEGDEPNRERVGFIAEEVAEADERLAQFDEDGEVTYFDMNGLVAHLVAEVQSLRSRVAALEEQVTVGAEG